MLGLKWPWAKKPEEKPKQEVIPPTNIRGGIFSTQFNVMLVHENEVIRRKHLQQALANTFQRGIETLKPVDAKGEPIPAGAGTFAMDEAYPSLTAAKLQANASGLVPFAQLDWYANQGFIGWQTCAMLSQNWLIDKACTMPGDDAVRNGWDISAPEGVDLDAKKIAFIKKMDKQFKIKQQCREFIKMGRIFGIRVALFVVDGIDYELPFNPDGVKPDSYKGITQIDPYWIAPLMDQSAASNPAAMDFYEPTWWIINGKRIHKSHFAIMRNGDDVPDILKPAYLYGGIPTPQKIFERVYAAEKTANEAPMLAMSKRMTVMNMDITQAAANQQEFNARMEYWSSLQNNFGVKVVGLDDKIEQFDTSLAEVDSTIMTQYQLVAAASNVPATKLLGTTPKGFNATGEYEESSYHEYLESIQENELQELVEGHYIRMIRSAVCPKFSMKPFEVEIAWKPVDSPTAEELAELNNKKADTDSKLVAGGAIDGYDVRQRLINDPDSGYHGIEDIVPDGPGDRDAQQEADGPLEQPVTAKAKAKSENQEGE